jgi:hypothetical protein
MFYRKNSQKSEERRDEKMKTMYNNFPPGTHQMVRYSFILLSLKNQ